MKLTPFAKLFITLIVLGVVGFAGYHYYGDQLRDWSRGGPGAKPKGDETKATAGVTKDDFGALKNLPDPDRKAGASGVQTATVGAGKVGRKLVVGINTWAGHSPGIVANAGLAAGSPTSVYKSRYGLDVEFVLLEDPQAKLAAVIKGDIDIMWDTVDSWAREASALAEQNISAKAILQQDWSRGGDGIVSLKSIQSIEDLKGKSIATTRYTPSHWLLLYMLSQSGLSPEDRRQIEKSLVFTTEAPLAAAAFLSLIHI